MENILEKGNSIASQSTISCHVEHEGVHNWQVVKKLFGLYDYCREASVSLDCAIKIDGYDYYIVPVMEYKSGKNGKNGVSEKGGILGGSKKG